MEIERVAVAIDVVCFALREERLTLLLVQREAEPFAGEWALPGGVVRGREGLDAAATRILAERTGLQVAYLEQLYTFGDPDRDPRGRTLSVAYYALLAPTNATEPRASRDTSMEPIDELLALLTPMDDTVAQPGRDVGAIRWTPVDELPPLAFDHARIAAYARQRLAQKISYAPLAFLILPEHFTMADLRRVHEAIEGRTYTHLSNFQTLMRSRWDLLRVPGEFDRRSKRPAQRYRYGGPLAIEGAPEGDDDHRRDAEDYRVKGEREGG